MAQQSYPGLILPSTSDRGRRPPKSLPPIVWLVLLGLIAAGWLIDPSAPPQQTTEPGDGPPPEELARRESAPTKGPATKPPMPKPETQPDQPPTDTNSMTGATHPVAPVPEGHLAAYNKKAGAEPAFPVTPDALSAAPPIPAAAAPRAPQLIDTPDSTERSAPGPVATPRRPPSGPLEQLRHRAEQGEPFSQYRLATTLWRMGNRHEAERWYRQAEGGLERLAARGNGQAQYTLGAMYAFGKGVQRDDGKARRYLTLAAGQRIEPAQRVLKIVERRSGEGASSGR